MATEKKFVIATEIKKKILLKLQELQERQKEVKKDYDSYDDHYTVREQKKQLKENLLIINSKIDILQECLNG